MWREIIAPSTSNTHTHTHTSPFRSVITQYKDHTDSRAPHNSVNGAGFVEVSFDATMFYLELPDDRMSFFARILGGGGGDKNIADIGLSSIQ